MENNEFDTNERSSYLDELDAYRLKPRKRWFKDKPWGASALFFLGLAASVGLFTHGVRTDNTNQGKRIVLVNQVSAESLRPEQPVSKSNETVKETPEEPKEAEGPNVSDESDTQERSEGLPAFSVGDGPISESDLALLNQYMRVPATMDDLHDYRYRYIVWGDELLRLSLNEGVDMYHVADLNAIDNLDLIYAGEVFRLPK